ncbi:MAG: DNA-3-methyladenine glycosylase family protein [Halobacteriota archaeon]
MIDRHGALDVRTHDDGFARLVRSIVRQQVSMKSAEAIYGRLENEFNVEPRALASASEADLLDVGLSRAKAGYVKSAARAFAEGELSVEGLAETDDDAAVEALTDVRGVGPWTAKMYLIFVLGRDDVFPVEDLGVRRAMESLYGLESAGEMRERSRVWKPYRTAATHYLWRHVD